VGLDVLLDTAASIYEEIRDLMYKPPIILKQMVRARLYGRKSKRGFYTY